MWLLTLAQDSISVCVPCRARVLLCVWWELWSQGRHWGAPFSESHLCAGWVKHPLPFSYEHKGWSPIILHVMRRSLKKTGVWQGKMGAFSCSVLQRTSLFGYVVMSEVLAHEVLRTWKESVIIMGCLGIMQGIVRRITGGVTVSVFWEHPGIIEEENNAWFWIWTCQYEKRIKSISINSPFTGRNFFNLSLCRLLLSEGLK